MKTESPHEAEFALHLRAAKFREVEDEFSLSGKTFCRQLRFGLDFSKKYWTPNARGFFADFAFARADGRILLMEIQGGIWRRGGGAHRGKGAIRDGVKSAAALHDDYDFMAITIDQIKNGAAMAAIDAWRKRAE